MVNAFETKRIEYMIIPMYKYMNQIVNTDSYHILFHLDGLYSYYILDIEN